MSLRGNVTTPDVIAEFEDSLRYGENTVIGRFGTIDRNRRDYPYTLDTTVVVVPDVQDKGRSLGRPFRDQILKEAQQCHRLGESDTFQGECPCWRIGK